MMAKNKKILRFFEFGSEEWRKRKRQKFQGLVYTYVQFAGQYEVRESLPNWSNSNIAVLRA